MGEDFQRSSQSDQMVLVHQSIMLSWGGDDMLQIGNILKSYW